jgi:hypothetical protein
LRPLRPRVTDNSRGFREPSSRAGQLKHNTNIIKVFTATRHRERELLGDRITSWLRAHPSIEISKTIVKLSSDHAFHCLSIVLVGHDPQPAGAPT